MNFEVEKKMSESCIVILRARRHQKYSLKKAIFVTLSCTLKVRFVSFFFLLRIISEIIIKPIEVQLTKLKRSSKLAVSAGKEKATATTIYSDKKLPKVWQANICTAQSNEDLEVLCAEQRGGGHVSLPAVQERQQECSIWHEPCQKSQGSVLPSPNCKQPCKKIEMNNLILYFVFPNRTPCLQRRLTSRRLWSLHNRTRRRRREWSTRGSRGRALPTSADSSRWWRLTQLLCCLGLLLSRSLVFGTWQGLKDTLCLGEFLITWNVDSLFPQQESLWVPQRTWRWSRTCSPGRIWWWQLALK